MKWKGGKPNTKIFFRRQTRRFASTGASLCCCCCCAVLVLVFVLLTSTAHGWTFTGVTQQTQPNGSRQIAIPPAKLGSTTDATNTNTNPNGSIPCVSRRDVLASTLASATTVAAAAGCIGSASTANALEPLSSLVVVGENGQQYALKFPTLFAPLYGVASRKTIKRSLGRNIWALEQNLELGPLQTPLRCTVIRLKDGSLWVHAPLAPTREFLELVESCGDSNDNDNDNDNDTTSNGHTSGSKGVVAHVVVPTYALEHKVFVKDCLKRWPDAQLWTSPGQFSFPFDASEEFVFGKPVTGVLEKKKKGTNTATTTGGANGNGINIVVPPWSDEIDYATLEGGTFDIGGKPTTLCETAFFHKASKSLIVTDAVAQIPTTVPPLNDPEQLLLISKRSTDDPTPNDTPEARLVGWKKTALLVSYFFPEHEEFDPNKAGVVFWTEGWQDNFDALAGRLVVPPVVRTLIYSQNPSRVKEWVDTILGNGRDGNDESEGWDFEQIVPAHFEAPIAATPKDFARAFRFLEDSSIDAFPNNDLARGLKPIADIALKRL